MHSTETNKAIEFPTEARMFLTKRKNNETWNPVVIFEIIVFR